ACCLTCDLADLRSYFVCSELGFPAALQRRQRSLKNLLRRSARRDCHQQTAVLVELDQWTGAAVVRLQTNRNRFRPVVFALVEIASAFVTNIFVARRLRDNMKDCLAIFAGATAAKSRNDLCFRKGEVEHCIELQLLLLHQLAKRIRLRQGARESVQNKSTAATQAADALADHLPHDLIGYQVAAIHEGDGRGHGRTLTVMSAVLRGTENISRGKMTGAEFLGQKSSLRSFADSGRPEQHQSPGIGQRAGWRRTMLQWPMKPSRTIIILWRSHVVSPRLAPLEQASPPR